VAELEGGGSRGLIPGRTILVGVIFLADLYLMLGVRS